MPLIRLRALEVADDPASDAMSGASSSAGSTRWLCWRWKLTRPSDSHRRSVSTLTPTAWATSPIRRYSATDRSLRSRVDGDLGRLDREGDDEPGLEPELRRGLHGHVGVQRAGVHPDQ